MSITEFKVGEKFPLPIQSQGDGGLFQYDINGAMFILKLSRVDLIAIEAFRTGKIETALFEQDDTAFFLYKIDGIFNAWGDCPISLHSLPDSKQPRLDGQQDKTLSLYFVDSQLDVLLAVRTLHPGDVFWQTLERITADQKAHPLSIADYTAKVHQVWQQLTSEQMAAQATVTETTGVAFDKLNPKAPLQ